MASAEALVKALVSQTWRDPQWSDSWRQKCWRLEDGNSARGETKIVEQETQ